MKAEIEKILEELRNKVAYPNVSLKQMDREKLALTQATSSLTALIIKWLEGKKGKLVTLADALDKETFKRAGRNQLITELIGELK